MANKRENETTLMAPKNSNNESINVSAISLHGRPDFDDDPEQRDLRTGTTAEQFGSRSSANGAQFTFSNQAPGPRSLQNANGGPSTINRSSLTDNPPTQGDQNTTKTFLAANKSKTGDEPGNGDGKEGAGGGSSLKLYAVIGTVLVLVVAGIAVGFAVMEDASTPIGGGAGTGTNAAGVNGTN